MILSVFDGHSRVCLLRHTHAIIRLLSFTCNYSVSDRFPIPIGPRLIYILYILYNMHIYTYIARSTNGTQSMANFALDRARAQQQGQKQKVEALLIALFDQLIGAAKRRQQNTSCKEHTAEPVNTCEAPSLCSEAVWWAWQERAALSRVGRARGYSGWYEPVRINGGRSCRFHACR